VDDGRDSAVEGGGLDGGIAVGVGGDAGGEMDWREGRSGAF